MRLDVSACIRANFQPEGEHKGRVLQGFRSAAMAAAPKTHEWLRYGQEPPSRLDDFPQGLPLPGRSMASKPGRVP